MKPLVFYDFTPAVNDQNNSVTIKKHRLEEIFQEIYNAGVEDGKKGKTIWTSTPRTSTPPGAPVPLNVPPIVKEVPNTFSNPYTQTCTALDDVNMIEQNRSIKNNITKGSTE